MRVDVVTSAGGRRPAAAVSGCPLCGGDLTRTMRARDTNRRLSSRPYDIGRCVSCRTLALLDVPRDLSLHYPPTYNDRPADVDPDPHPEMYKLEITERWAPRRPCTVL